MPKVLIITSIQCLCNLKKELSCEVDVLHVYKHESLLKIDINIFDGFGQSWVNLQCLCVMAS